MVYLLCLSSFGKAKILPSSTLREVFGRRYLKKKEFFLKRLEVKFYRNSEI